MLNLFVGSYSPFPEAAMGARSTHSTVAALRPRSHLAFAGALSLVSLFAILTTGCTDERIVFKERELFEQPPDSVNNFLGYFDTQTKLTVCGNCHVGQHASWEATGHADAWNSLQASGGAQAFCEGCHAISELGNDVTVPAGVNLVRDERYYDVQCETCHGPGLTHVENPDASQPLARLAVDSTVACGECHQGTHHPFVEEWAQSPHASPFGEFFPGGCAVGACAAARPECQACHRGQGVLEAWGERADYIEKGSAEHLPITCGVCHDPHDATNEGQLRFPVATTSIEEHLCARCHNRRTAPDPTSSHGLEPHAPEADLLVGDAGWFPPGATINQGEIRGTHGSGRNAKLCATCHVSGFTVTDAVTGDFVFSATGHLFRPIPCLDAEGKPLPFENGCELSTTARSFASCTDAACHGDEQAAFSALTAATTRIQLRADELLSQLVQVDPNLEDAGGEIDPNEPTFTVAEGAFFNYNLATFGSQLFGTNTVVGSSVHNPFLVEALLIASIQAVIDQYGISPSTVDLATNWRVELQAVLRRAGM